MNFGFVVFPGPVQIQIAGGFPLSHHRAWSAREVAANEKELSDGKLAILCANDSFSMIIYQDGCYNLPRFFLSSSLNTTSICICI